MVELVLVRHGESLANKNNEYTGWSDVPLTTKGINEAKAAGVIIRDTGIHFSQVHTSVLKRAIITSNIIMEETNQLWLPIQKNWRLNERHYGALRGLNKEDTKRNYGVEQVAQWRRSYTSVPPSLSVPDSDRRYSYQLERSLPTAESLKMAFERILPYWQDVIAPELRQGKNQLVVAHGSTLRALIKYLENISDSDIDGVEVPNGEPILYTLNDDLTIKSKQILTQKK
ncbi:2,3-bisphosphoglycerate-dependent phosphoglycerate mutase [Dellaglioa sp. BT-FLS60]